MSQNSRECPACGISYPLTTEYWFVDNKRSPAFTRRCKTCDMAATIERRKRNMTPERAQAMRDYAREYQRQRRARLRAERGRKDNADLS